MTSTNVQPGIQNIPDAGSYALDPTHSYVAFTARHLMVTKVRGRFPVTDGRLVVSDDANLSSVEATIDVSAVESGDPSATSTSARPTSSTPRTIATRRSARRASRTKATATSHSMAT